MIAAAIMFHVVQAVPCGPDPKRSRCPNGVGHPNAGGRRTTINRRYRSLTRLAGGGDVGGGSASASGGGSDRTPREAGEGKWDMGRAEKWKTRT